MAFSVAAHLDPDILILDEVLAVGDAGFQKKSLRKITETMEQGCTVLFVSHSMSAVQQLCSKGMLLNNGRIEFMGDTDELTARYMDITRVKSVEEKINAVWENKERFKNDYFIPRRMYVADDKGHTITKSAPNNVDKWVTFELDVKKPSESLTIGFAIYSPSRSLLFMSYPNDIKKEDWPQLIKGKQIMRARLPAHLLNTGKYKISMIGGLHNKFWIFEPGGDVPTIEMEIDQGLSDSPYWTNPREGVMAPIIDWEVKK